MNGATALSDFEQKAIDEALTNNSAVGIVAGSYDEKLSVSMASSLFIRSLGYTSEEFSEASPHSLLEFVTEDDYELFAPEVFESFEGSFKFRMADKLGERVYAYAYKTDSFDSEGNKHWILSVRVSREVKVLHQFMRGLARLVVRYAICDLDKGTYAFYNCDKNDSDVALGTYPTFLDGMVDQLSISTHLEELAKATTPENIRIQLRANKNLFRYDYVAEDNCVFYRLSITPIEYEGGVLKRCLILVMDVTEAHREEIRTQEALRDACLSANKANEAKTQFLSNMSHDIRTPMNAIIGMTAIATAHIDQKERVLDCLGKITTSSRHLLGLINEILDMGRIERGKMILNDENFSLSELVDSMIEMVKPSLADRHHEFDVHILNIEHEDVYGDSLRIQQVFTNIVGNAVKYTPDGGKITLSISEKPTQHTNVACYEFVVEDNGMGMDEEFLNHIFEPFMRADNANASGVQGTGLGMPIAKNIVNMMNGDIKVESELNKGTKVTATIFLRLQNPSETNDETLANLPVLVVDDDRVCCESTVETLVSIGMQGEWVDNGQDAVACVKEHHDSADDYHAVIIDWKMPVMDGLETTRAIRKAVGADIPIIMLTAYDFAEIEQEAREAGVNLFISKPLFRSRLRSAFTHLANKTAMERETSKSVVTPTGKYADKRILIVEDNLLNREIMVEIVGETGAVIETAENGKIAVDMVNEAPSGYYDLVFMDIQMPVMNGYDATMAIRALPNGKGATLPIVALTANAFAEDVVMAKSAGVNEHVSKPIDIERLDQVMKTWIG